jgi:Fe-Mn family superoxide dismutase
MFNLPELPYSYDGLEPHIDKTTMEIHHDKHHAAYVTNLNNAVKGTELENMAIEEILKNISKHPPAVRNNGGGHYNHEMFWNIMSPDGGGEPSGELADAINSSFGSLDKLKEQMNDAGVKRFGSGWSWLVVQNGKLAVGSTPNQDNPIMDVSELKGTPILGIDVWEHAYYLKYQNKRPDYLKEWWNTVNWKEVERRFKEAGSK